MSYCVNCGVELDASLKKCPLCSTPVINPNVIPYDMPNSPYPTQKGQVDTVKRKDVALLVSIFLLTCAITCGLLNLLVFPQNLWSLIVIGFCLLLWVILVPFLIYKKTSPYVALFLDGAATVVFLALISKLVGSNEWFIGLGLPITVLVTADILFFTFCYRKINSSILATVLYFFLSIPIICVGIELLCRRYFETPYRITWSAVVLTVCVIFIITIITMLATPRLREAARRRLHF